MTEKVLRGFARVDREAMRDISSKGGRAAHAVGRAHEFTREQASAAAKKMHENRRARKAAEAK